jgi:DNA helicase TIP49 (TBP-interacting protein)
MMQQANKDMIEIKCMEDEISGPAHGIKKDLLDRMIKVSKAQINTFYHGSFAPELFFNNN